MKKLSEVLNKTLSQKVDVYTNFAIIGIDVTQELADELLRRKWAIMDLAGKRGELLEFLIHIEELAYLYVFDKASIKNAGFSLDEVRDNIDKIVSNSFVNESQKKMIEAIKKT